MLYAPYLGAFQEVCAIKGGAIIICIGKVYLWCTPWTINRHKECQHDDLTVGERHPSSSLVAGILTSMFSSRTS